MKKTHTFNIVAGVIVLLTLGRVILEGSNLLPHALIILFFFFYYLQVKNKEREFALFLNVIILVFSLWTLLPLLFAP